MAVLNIRDVPPELIIRLKRESVRQLISSKDAVIEAVKEWVKDYEQKPVSPARAVTKEKRDRAKADKIKKAIRRK